MLHHCTEPGCGKYFARRSDFNRHVKIHTNERAYQCSYVDCGKSFVQKAALTVHQRIHTGERPYRCQLCQKAFADPSSLCRHGRVHTGKRPYACAIINCGESFCRDSSLRRHFFRCHAAWDRTSV